MKVDIVVACYQQEKYWPLLRAGFEANREHINRVIVVNDGPALDLLAPDGVPTVFLGHPHEGFGLCKSLNQGITAAETEYVLLQEGDEFLPPGSLAETLKLAQPERLVCAWKQYADFDAPDVVIEEDHRKNYLKPNVKVREWRICSGGHLLTHRPSHIALGGFNEAYTYGLHDYDYAARWLLRFKLDSVVLGGGVITHIGTGKGRSYPSPENEKLFVQVLGDLVGRHYHLGCEMDMLNDYVNVDFFPYGVADVILDCTSLEWLPDNYALSIKHKHFIEHLALPNAIAHLKAVFQKLAPEGILDITFPDVNKAAVRLLAGTDNFSALEAFYGPQDKCHLPGQHHLWGWSQGKMEEALKNIGFEIEYTGEDESATFARWRDTRIQAVKPSEPE